MGSGAQYVIKAGTPMMGAVVCRYGQVQGYSVQVRGCSVWVRGCGVQARGWAAVCG